MQLPPDRCSHGVTAEVINLDTKLAEDPAKWEPIREALGLAGPGWKIPLRPSACKLCSSEPSTGLDLVSAPWKIPGPDVPHRIPGKLDTHGTPKTAKCPEPGCELYIEEGRPHPSPHLPRKQ